MQTAQTAQTAQTTGLAPMKAQNFARDYRKIGEGTYTLKVRSVTAGIPSQSMLRMNEDNPTQAIVNLYAVSEGEYENAKAAVFVDDNGQAVIPVTSFDNLIMTVEDNHRNYDKVVQLLKGEKVKVTTKVVFSNYSQANKLIVEDFAILENATSEGEQIVNFWEDLPGLVDNSNPASESENMHDDDPF